MSCKSAAQRTSRRGTACRTTCFVCFHTSLWRHSPSPKPTSACDLGQDHVERAAGEQRVEPALGIASHHDPIEPRADVAQRAGDRTLPIGRARHQDRSIRGAGLGDHDRSLEGVNRPRRISSLDGLLLLGHRPLDYHALTFPSHQLRWRGSGPREKPAKMSIWVQGGVRFEGPHAAESVPLFAKAPARLGEDVRPAIVLGFRGDRRGPVRRRPAGANPPGQGLGGPRDRGGPGP